MSKTERQAKYLAPCGRTSGTCGQATQTCGREGCQVEVRPARFDPVEFDRVLTVLFPKPCRCGPDGCADSVACPRHNRNDG